MSSYHQTFFLPAGKSWEINFVPRVKTSPRSTFIITCTNLNANPSVGVTNSFLYLINIPASSGSAISTEGDPSQISNSIVLASNVVSSTGIASHQDCVEEEGGGKERRLDGKSTKGLEFLEGRRRGSQRGALHRERKGEKAREGYHGKTIKTH